VRCSSSAKSVQTLGKRFALTAGGGGIDSRVQRRSERLNAVGNHGDGECMKSVSIFSRLMVVMIARNSFVVMLKARLACGQWVFFLSKI
jgi:hypothetical protein